VVWLIARILYCWHQQYIVQKLLSLFDGIFIKPVALDYERYIRRAFTALLIIGSIMDKGSRAITSQQEITRHSSTGRHPLILSELNNQRPINKKVC